MNSYDDDGIQPLGISTELMVEDLAALGAGYLFEVSISDRDNLVTEQGKVYSLDYPDEGTVEEYMGESADYNQAVVLDNKILVYADDSWRLAVINLETEEREDFSSQNDLIEYLDNM